MTLAEIKAWLATHAREYDDAGISPEQAVALCRWKLSDKVDRDGWTGLLLVPASRPDLTSRPIQSQSP